MTDRQDLSQGSVPLVLDEAAEGNSEGVTTFLLEDGDDAVVELVVDLEGPLQSLVLFIGVDQPFPALSPHQFPLSTDYLNIEYKPLDLDRLLWLALIDVRHHDGAHLSSGLPDEAYQGKFLLHLEDTLALPVDFTQLPEVVIVFEAVVEIGFGE